MSGDSIKLDKYQGGFVLNHFWTVHLNFAPDGTGELEFTESHDPTTRQHCKVPREVTQLIADLIDRPGAITAIPSATDLHTDMGYGAPLVHVDFRGKHFFHTEPEGTYGAAAAAPPTDDQQLIFVTFCNHILQLCHRLIPNIPTDIYQN